jgi:Protein of unknown function (DUF819)
MPYYLIVNLSAVMMLGRGLQVIQERTALGRYLSGPLLALAVGLGLAVAGILPISCQSYNVVYETLLPFASALLLLEADLRG